jgi:WD40 repeat protein
MCNGELRHVGFGADERTLLAGVVVWGNPRKLELRLYDEALGSEARRILLLAKEGNISGLTVAGHGNASAISLEDGRVFLVSHSTWETQVIRKAAEGHVYTPAFSPDGRLLAGGIWTGQPGSAVIHLWDGRSGEERKTIAVPQGDVVAVAFAPDGKSLVSIGSGYLNCWDIDSGRRLGNSPRTNDWSPTGWLAYAQDGRTLFRGSGSLLIRHDVELLQRP